VKAPVRRFGHGFFCLVFCLAMQALAHGATLYVSPTGNDMTGNGTAGSPWRNIQFAINHASFTPGSEIIAADGDYSPFFIAKSGATANARYTIRAAAANTRILGEIANDGRRASVHITANFVTVDGFIVDVQKTAADTNGIRSRGIRVSGIDTQHVLGVRILNNKVSNAGWVGISTSYAQDVLIEGNEISFSRGQHGVYVANSADGPIIRRNIAHHNQMAGIQINSDPAAPGDGIISNAVVEQNISYSNGAIGGGSFDFASIRNARIVNNLSYDNTGQGMVFWDDGFDPAFGCKDNLIANNTVVMPAGSGHVLSLRNGSTGNTLRNNVLIHLDPSNNDSIAIDAESLTAAFSSNYNIVTRFENTAGSLVSLATWRTQTGQDMNSFVGTTSIFTNYAARVFTLAAASPALNAGTTVAQVTNDILGTPRPQGAAFDIGAYETVVATNNPPGAPTIGTAVAGLGQVAVHFTQPASNGGSTITGYTATCASQSASGMTSPIVVSGLAAGVPVTCIVIATNANGNSQPSAASNSVTPTGPPGAPTAVTAVAGVAQASVYFTPPANNGGSAITGYTATCSTQSATGANSPLVVMGLTPGMAVTCTVIATNIHDSSIASMPSNSVTPPTAPGAPVFNSAIEGDGQVTALFSPPPSDGGSPISSYSVQCTANALPTRSNSGPMSPITVTGMNNGTVYACSITATNLAAYTSPASAVLMPTPSTGTPLALSGVQSRKMHGANAHDIQIDGNAMIGGAITVEPRHIGSGHRVVFQFNQTVASVGGATALNASNAAVGNVGFSYAGKEVTVVLTGISDNQRVRVAATGVNGMVDASAAIGFFSADVSGNRAINAVDVSAAKARSGNAVTTQNFRMDLNLSGQIDATDISAVKARSGRTLQP
jgi:parallel beta-helix repeat protein